MTRWMPALLAVLAMQAAASQTVWRCGPEGRVTYSDTPCPGGRTVAAADARTAHERTEAAQVVSRDRALADRLRDERLALQREQREQMAAAGPGAGSLGGAARSLQPVAATKKPKAPKPPKKAQKAKQPPVPQPAGAGTSPSAGLSIRPRSG